MGDVPSTLDPIAPPRLAACSFGTGAGEQWPRLARVLAATAAHHCPHWSRSIVALPVPPPIRRAGVTAAYGHNAHKTAWWAARVAEAPTGTRLLLVDVDLMILQPLDALWAEPFDLAYTVRTAARFPFNAGVVAVRVSDPIRAFMRRWDEMCLTLLGDPLLHLRYRRLYGGLAQAALGAVLEGHAPSLTMRTLPCAEWNCEDSAWRNFDPARTRIVHVKSGLRRAIFCGAPAPPPLRPLITLWRRLEQASLAAAAPAASAATGPQVSA